MTFNVVAKAANFNGGLLEFTVPGGGYGTLATTNIVFGGGTTLLMNVEAANPPWSNDQITCNNCTINGRNTIDVSEDAQPTRYNTFWTLIYSQNQIQGDFTNVDLPTGIVEEPVTNKWECSYEG